jgi:hypothetical protein
VIVGDTSVWIDVLGGRRGRRAQRCIELIEAAEPAIVES